MRMSFRNFMQLDELAAGRYLSGARLTGLPLDAPAGWEFPDMHEPVTYGPRVGGMPWATSFTQAAQLSVREDLQMKLNTLQRVANVVKSLVAYKMDPANTDSAHTGKTIVNLDYDFVPPLFNPDGSRNEDCVPGKCKIIGVVKKDILSSGLQTHGMQINPAEIGYLEEKNILRSNPTDTTRYDISTRALVREMLSVRDEYQNRLRAGQGMDTVSSAIRDVIGRGGRGKLALGHSAR